MWNQEMKLYNIYSGNDLVIAELIQRRRLQLLIHSYLYYELDTNIIDDRKWDMWAKELVKLQKENPDISKKVCYYEAFKDWDASTGAFLPFDDWVKNKAHKFKASLTITKQDDIKVTPPKKGKQLLLF